jgi:hypothetical protein
MPSARTSVANKEYECKKGKEQHAAKLQQVAVRRETIRGGNAEVVVALRHGANLKQHPPACQRFSYDDFFFVRPSAV